MRCEEKAASQPSALHLSLISSINAQSASGDFVAAHGHALQRSSIQLAAMHAWFDGALPELSMLPGFDCFTMGTVHSLKNAAMDARACASDAVLIAITWPLVDFQAMRAIHCLKALLAKGVAACVYDALFVVSILPHVAPLTMRTVDGLKALLTRFIGACVHDALLVISRHS